ncbi:hypothetical protein GCM10025862_22630 [Arsenicicoccus piscis]|uniref:Uncharacterized protein n=2 Tax=Arsenicicoccus piscis TaxID=673954 RepID=A0ABQ6HPY9_9MICO|nr:hypothetical protein GCM10025862_22630 [Arsenicicoccus piscis]
MTEHGVLRKRRLRRAADEIEAIVIKTLRERMGDLRGGHGIEDHAALVVDGTASAYTAADDVVASLT